MNMLRPVALLFLCLLFLGSCSSDNSNPSTPSDDPTQDPPGQSSPDDEIPGDVSGPSSPTDPDWANRELESSGGLPTFGTQVFTFESVRNEPVPMETTYPAFFHDDLRYEYLNPDTNQWDKDFYYGWFSVSEDDYSDRFTVSIVDSNLAPGTYIGYVRVTDYTQVNFSFIESGFKDIRVVYTVTEDVAVNKENLTFRLFDQSSTTLSQPLELYSGENQWQITADPWMEVLPASGTGVGDVDIRVHGDSVNLPAGIHQGTVSITHDLTQQQLNIPVKLVLEPYRLFVPEDGVALSSLQPTHSVNISDNAGATTAWEVNVPGNATWLNAAPLQGMTGDSLSLSADGTGLEPGYYETSISLNSVAHGGYQATIKVGFYRADDNATPPPSPLQIPGRDRVVTAVDPVRPYVYVADSPSTVQRVHLYTHALTGEILLTEQSAPDITHMTAGTDGALLYIEDNANRQIKVVDLSTLEVVATWNEISTYDQRINAAKTRYIRINGRPALMNTQFLLFDGLTGQWLGDLASQSIGLYRNASIITPTGAIWIYHRQDSRPSTPAQTSRRSLFYSHIDDPAFFTTDAVTDDVRGLGYDNILQNIGLDRTCVVENNNTTVRCFATTIPLASPLFTINDLSVDFLKLDRSNRLYVVDLDDVSGSPQVDIFAADGTFLHSVALPEGLTGFEVSADGQRFFSVVKYPTASSTFGFNLYFTETGL